MNQTYFSIEGVVGSGKSTTMGWMGDMLETDGYKFNLIPEPLEKFKRWGTYDPLAECYRNPASSAVMAHIHIMKQSLSHYSQNVVLARRSDCDVIVSDRSILSPQVFANTYFLRKIFSPYTKDSLTTMWEEEMSNRYEILNVKPDVIIFLNTELSLVEERLKNDRSSARSPEETAFMNHGTLLAMEPSYVSLLEKMSIPHHKVFIDSGMTPRDVAQKVYNIIREEMCAEGGGGFKSSECEFSCSEDLN